MRMRPLILVSEDDSYQRISAVRILAGAGYDVLEAPDAEKAFKLLEENPAVAVLFTDIIMPGMSGFALADLALRRWPTLRVLFTTTREKLRDIDQQPGLLSGIILLKPFSRQELISAVDRTLTGPAPNKGAAEAATVSSTLLHALIPPER
jgi:CheY-like chemotaxis protein